MHETPSGIPANDAKLTRSRRGPPCMFLRISPRRLERTGSLGGTTGLGPLPPCGRALWANGSPACLFPSSHGRCLGSEIGPREQRESLLVTDCPVYGKSPPAMGASQDRLPGSTPGRRRVRSRPSISPARSSFDLNLCRRRASPVRLEAEPGTLVGALRSPGRYAVFVTLASLGLRCNGPPSVRAV